MGSQAPGVLVSDEVLAPDSQEVASKKRGLDKLADEAASQKQAIPKIRDEREISIITGPIGEDKRHPSRVLKVKKGYTVKCGPRSRRGKCPLCRTEFIYNPDEAEYFESTTFAPDYVACAIEGCPAFCQVVFDEDEEEEDEVSCDETGAPKAD